MYCIYTEKLLHLLYYMEAMLSYALFLWKFSEHCVSGFLARQSISFHKSNSPVPFK